MQEMPAYSDSFQQIRINPNLCKICTVTFSIRKTRISRKNPSEKAVFFVTKEFHAVFITLLHGYLPESYQQFPPVFQQLKNVEIWMVSGKSGVFSQASNGILFLFLQRFGFHNLKKYAESNFQKNTWQTNCGISSREWHPKQTTVREGHIIVSRDDDMIRKRDADIAQRLTYGLRRLGVGTGRKRDAVHMVVTENHGKSLTGLQAPVIWPCLLLQLHLLPLSSLLCSLRPAWPSYHTSSILLLFTGSLHFPLPLLASPSLFPSLPNPFGCLSPVHPSVSAEVLLPWGSLCWPLH